MTVTAGGGAPGDIKLPKSEPSTFTEITVNTYRYEGPPVIPGSPAKIYKVKIHAVDDPNIVGTVEVVVN